MNFANFNPTLNYNRMAPNLDTNNISFDKYANDINQQNEYQYGGNNKLNDNYYCDGYSKLTTESMQMDPTPVSKLFFSSENIARIQRKLKQAVLNESNGEYKMADQDELDLLVVMRAVFFDKAKNLNKAIVRQVKILNQQTVDYILPDLMTNIKQYYGYIRDINRPLQPIMRPMNVNRAGRKTLGSFTSVWI